jgi:hypothetical protein
MRPTLVAGRLGCPTVPTAPASDRYDSLPHRLLAPCSQDHCRRRVAVRAEVEEPRFQISRGVKPDVHQASQCSDVRHAARAVRSRSKCCSQS